MKSALWRRLSLAFVLAAASYAAVGCAPSQSSSPAAPPSATVDADHGTIDVTLRGLALGGVRTAVTRYQTMVHLVRMSGQVAVTESGHADITVPLNGVIEKPLVKVGDRVEPGTPIAIVNSVFGQTSLQLMQKLEADKQALIMAQSSQSQAQTGLGSALSTWMQARTALSQAQDNMHQADAELRRARTDLSRKRELLKGGVAAVADVEDARERYEKAISAYQDSRGVIEFFKRSLRAAQENVPPARDTVRLARGSVTLTQVTLQRDLAIFSQQQVSGSSLPQNLTPVHLEGGGNGRNTAATTEFYLRSPIGGTVTSVVMSAGQSANPGTVVASVLNTRQVYVDANAFDSDQPFVKVGDPVAAQAAAFPQIHFTGRVSYVGQQVDAATRTVPVRSLIDNAAGVLKAGTFLSVTLTPRLARHTLGVPENAVLVHGESRFVFVETSPNHFEKRAVEVGVTQNGQIEISRGLKAGDKVVTDGNLLLEGQD